MEGFGNPNFDDPKPDKPSAMKENMNKTLSAMSSWTSKVSGGVIGGVQTAPSHGEIELLRANCWQRSSHGRIRLRRVRHVGSRL